MCGRQEEGGCSSRTHNAGHEHQPHAPPLRNHYDPQASIATAREAFIRKKLGLPEPEDEMAQPVSDGEAGVDAADDAPSPTSPKQSSNALDMDEDDMLALFDVDAVAAASQAPLQASSQSAAAAAATAAAAGPGPEEEEDFAPPEFFDDMDFDALDAAAAAAGF